LNSPLCITNFATEIDILFTRSLARDVPVVCKQHAVHYYICSIYNNNNNIIPQQCLWCHHYGQGHYKSSPGLFDDCRLSAGWPPTIKPSQLTWVVSSPVGCYHPHPPLPFIIIIT